MNTRTMILAVSVTCLALIQVAGWAQEKYEPTATEELYGTWANEAANPQEVVLTPGGFEDYASVSDSVPAESGTLRIDGKWTDADGNVWYRAFLAVSAGPLKETKTQTLQRISSSGASREAVSVKVVEFDPSLYPARIDPEDKSYLAYNRAGKYVVQTDEVVYGTWTNKSMPRQKVVAWPGGAKLYTKITDTIPFEEAKELIAEKWTDSEGNVWYKTFSIFTSGPNKGIKNMSLLKIGKSGTVREVFYRNVGFFSLTLSAPKIDPTDRPHYALWYRAEE